MTFWPLTNSDFPTDQTFHQFHDLYTELDLHRIMSGFHGAFATGVASQQGTLTLPDTWFRPAFWDLLMLQLLRPNFSNLPCLCSTFHIEYPLVLSRFCLKIVILESMQSICAVDGKLISKHVNLNFCIETTPLHFFKLWSSGPHRSQPCYSIFVFVLIGLSKLKFPRAGEAVARWGT